MKRYIEKPWGSEIIWAATNGYVGKILFVAANHVLSIQYHDYKDETMYVLEGRGALYFYPENTKNRECGEPILPNERIEMVSGRAIHIPPGKVHRVEAFTDMTILEASTDHLDDIVRLADVYGRA